MKQKKMSLTAYAENESTAPYPLWVGETQVTSLNAGDVLGDGTVRFTPAEGENPAILILNGVNITTGYSATGIRYEGEDALNIELEDGSDNSIIKDASSEFFIGFASIDPEADVIVSGTGKLTVDSAGGGIFCERNVAITGGTVTASSSSCGYGIASFQGRRNYSS